METKKDVLAKKSRLILILMLGVMLACNGAVLYGQDGHSLTAAQKRQADQINNIFRRAVNLVKPAVVYLMVEKTTAGPLTGHSTGLGSGVIIDKTGWIATNHHVVENTDRIEVVLPDGRHFLAQATYSDPDTDLAVVKIDPKGHDLPYAVFGDSDKTQVGDFVMAIGSPFGTMLSQTVTAGIISYKGRQTNILGKWGYEDFIQTDADINQGNSGGPLINLYGEIIGINSNIFTPTGVSAGYGFAIPSNLAKFVTKQLIANHVVKRGYLGVSLRAATLEELRNIPDKTWEDTLTQLRQMPNQADEILRIEKLRKLLASLPKSMEGVLVENVEPGAPAAKGGMQELDIILSINGIKMKTSKQLRDKVAHMKPGDKVKVTVWRHGVKKTLNIILADRNIARKKYQQEQLAQRSTPPNVPKILPFELPFDHTQPPPGQAAGKPKLGVTVQPMTEELARDFGYPANTSGIVIVEVNPNSVAAESGLKPGDIIISIEGVKVNSIATLRKLIQKADFDKGTKMTVRNKDERRVVTLKHRVI